MNPDEFDADHEPVRALHRAATGALDERPASRVRAAVLAEAARVIPSPTFGMRHWPRSLAAVLVVSVMAGLVVTRTLRDEPEPLATRAESPTRTVTPEQSAAAPAPTAAATSATAPAFADTQSLPAAKPPAPVRSAPARPSPGPATPIAEPSREKAAVMRDARSDSAFRTSTATAPPAPAAAIASSPNEPSTSGAVPAANIVATPQAPAAAVAPAPRVTARARIDASTDAGDATPVPPPASADRFARPARSADTPEALVERIVRLRHADQDADADRLLATLRARYPDFVVPPAALRASDLP